MNQRLYKVAAAHSNYFNNYHKYRMVRFDKFDYSILTNNIMYYKKKGKFQKGTWNDVIIAADTETSKSHEVSSDPLPNHVCAWTISVRAYHCNICTIYGTRPSEMIEAFKKIREALKGDDIYIFWHNFAYDHWFMRRFLYLAFGEPKKQLNTKPHYPIMIGFDNGIIMKDSLILAQCKLEKWANDLNVKHKKAVGSWDYDFIRDQGDKLSRSELHYIENDTLALCECVDALCVSLNKSVFSLPYTATGIPREEVRERAKKHKGHENFIRQAPTYEQNEKLRKLYHGGYSHSNRFYNSLIMDDDVTEGGDFASSYPFSLIAFKDYPSGAFKSIGMDVEPEYILENMKDYAFIFKITFQNIRLKEHLTPMPALQASKCEYSINMKTDNGRILQCGYCCLYICDLDLEVIADQYKWDECICTEVEASRKDYLPRWFTDYVYELFEAKCRLKPLKSKDPVAYALAKSRVNSVYGLCCQMAIRQNFIEVTEPGEYKINENGDTAYFESGEYRIDYDEDPRKAYEKYLNNPNTVLPYFWGTYCTAIAFRNLFKLGKCVKRYYNKDGSLSLPPRHFYSDTDSIYSDDWDKEKVAEYNKWCKELLRANNYGPVVVNEKEYWLGVAEFESDGRYTEFVSLGSKRYAGRSEEDGELHITVAGVPKSGAKCLKDDLTNFTRGFVFDGETTGKLGHFYLFAKDGIYTDEFGNEIGDSIDLQPCDYRLDAVDREEYLMTDDYYFTYFGEDGFDTYDH